MSGGGGSTSTNKFQPPDYTVQPWQDYLTQAQGLAKGGITPYGGQTVANLTPMTGGGLQMLTDFAMQGSPERAAGGAALLNATQGFMNPYAVQSNPYAGQNPYLAAMLDASNSNISDKFAKGTAAQTDAAAARSGAFGGSAYNEMTQDNAKTLGGLLASNTNNLLGKNYDQSSQLAENALNRASGAYDTTQNRALQGASIGQGQQGLDLQSIMSLIQGGQIPQKYQQDLLNAGKDFYQQGQQAPFTMSDFLRNALASASGGYGTNTQTGPGQNPLMGLLGGGAAAYGMFGGGG